MLPRIPLELEHVCVICGLKGKERRMPLSLPTSQRKRTLRSRGGWRHTKEVCVSGHVEGHLHQAVRWLRCLSGYVKPPSIWDLFAMVNSVSLPT